MGPSVALEQNREAVRDAVRKDASIADPRVFGSVARGNDGDGSDRDLLVDALPGTSLFVLRRLPDGLECVLGVDVVTTRGLASRIRNRVLAEAMPL